ncbi:MAG TPA: hypothetical protein DIT07_02545 [Sphingobacteriaceae bacterium]|nr:hypothetical protein [Sphingobacteriaceae bacterium]
MKKIPLSFYNRKDVVKIAKELLGKIIVTNFDGMITSGRIVETEAYAGIIDKASHSFGGRRTARNEHMYSPPGTAYVYICYGMHQMMNIVTNEKCPACDGTGEIKASILLMDDIENNLKFILNEQNEKNITLNVHPYVEAYIRKGIFSCQVRWFFKYWKWIKVNAIASYYLTEFHFLNSRDEEIKL